MNETRFQELDLLRLLAVIGMIVFHFFFLLDYYHVAEFQMFAGGFHILGQSVRFTFLGLVGIGLSISYQKHALNRAPETFYHRQLKRGVIILSCALLVTLATWLVVPSEFVRFGILHLIGIGIIISSAVAHRTILSLALGLILIFIQPFTSSLTVATNIFYPLGISTNTISAVDYFPIIPWLSLILIGIFIGHYLYLHGQRQFQLPKIITESKMGISGKWSLIIYLVHVPIIVGIMIIFGRYF